MTNNMKIPAAPTAVEGANVPYELDKLARRHPSLQVAKEKGPP
jgi:hypothetical protein